MNGRLLAAGLVVCMACDGGSTHAPGVGRDGGTGDAGSMPEEDAHMPEVDAGSADGGPFEVGCLEAAGFDDVTTTALDSGGASARVSVTGEGCAKRYTLSSTQVLRESPRTDGKPRLPDNPRVLVEQEGASNVRTRNTLFDALYALALEEARENSVSGISDFSFDGIDCPEGGCFETGRDWTYVWTRDTAYAVDLGLAALDPLRARNSLEFKLSALRSGGGTQIVQDTGTGGSYPISSDRVVWALGASTLLNYLQADERRAFAARAYEAIVHTIEHDRQVVYDASDGLYRGEQSFLDWREQTYPAWTRDQVVHIGMSKALSTNVLHATILKVASELAAELDEDEAATRFSDWASALRSRIAERFWLADDGQYSTMLTTSLDASPVRRFDALGTALAVLAGVGDPAQRRAAIAHYPQLPMGLPVIWPQQPDTPIYHNRAIWPFVSAYFMKAARAVENDQAVAEGVRSLMRASALNLSNMENLELASGLPFHEDGAMSGPVVNSQRQLWSVAGYLSMVHDVLFGLEVSPAGLRVKPFVPRALRRTLFASADSLVLNDFPFHGKTVSVRVRLPKIEAGEGAYAVGEITLNGKPIGADFVSTASLSNRNLFEVQLVDGVATNAALTRVTDVGNGRALFSPRTPRISGIGVQNGKIGFDVDLDGASAGNVRIDVFRDGERIAHDLSGSIARFVDPSAEPNGPTRCYSLALRDVATNTSSQHAEPACYWGPSAERITTFGLDQLEVHGGTRAGDVLNDFGGEGDWLRARLTPSHTGAHLLQLSYANGAGNTTTGVTCGVKRFVVRAAGEHVGGGIALMPHTNALDAFRDSSFVAVELEAGVVYEVELLSDDTTLNMSRFSHFASYRGTGGQAGAYERVTLRALKVLRLAGDR